MPGPNFRVVWLFFFKERVEVRMTVWKSIRLKRGREDKDWRCYCLYLWYKNKQGTLLEHKLR